MNFEEIMKDKEFCEQLSKTTTAEEAVALFSEKGVKIPLEYVQEAYEGLLGSELSEEDMESVAGGLRRSNPWGFYSKTIGYLNYRMCGMDRKTAWEMATDVHDNGP